MVSEDDNAGVGAGYPVGQLAKAFVTALIHEDGRTRWRAGRRVRKWEQVLAGMASGSLRVGSRTPIAGLPAWVTPEVVRGGFATGSPAAGGALALDEVALAERLGVPAARSALFAYFVSDPGQDDLASMLASGTYRVTVPEEAALLVVAWLARNGRAAEALDLVETIMPFSDRLRFWPRVASDALGDPEIVWRETAGEVRESVAARKPNPQIE